MSSIGLSNNLKSTDIYKKNVENAVKELNCENVKAQKAEPQGSSDNINSMSTVAKKMSGSAVPAIKCFGNDFNNPKEIISEIRDSKGPGRDKGLLNFQNTIDKMSQPELKEMRDYIGNEMASPKNDDDELLGQLLNKVNQELDSRKNYFDPMPTPVPFPHNFPEFIDPGFSDPMPQMMHKLNSGGGTISQSGVAIAHKLNAVKE